MIFKKKFNYSTYLSWTAKIIAFILFLQLCGYRFDVFPLGQHNWGDMSGEHFPLSKSTRAVLSIIWNSLLFSMFATIALYKKKCFENTGFYLAYKKFWFVGGAIFSLIFLILIDFMPANIGKSY
ncbi:hypothetical protein, partial [Methyloglobulus sp.]|uniref:hypothetical protein n=1 Tax=Methyloglobulus sp. TaxID=2518622 RepID=UPI0032B7D2F5